MNPRRYLLRTGWVWAALLVSTVSAKPLNVLYFTKSSGFEHSVVKRGPQGEPSYSERVLTTLGAAHDIALTCSKDGGLFSPEYLAQFDVVFFYTSGNLLAVGSDGNPAMTPAGKQALLDWVAAGGGFMAVHAGGDTFHTYETSGGNPPQSERTNRYRLNGEASDAYVKLLGGEFINHGPQQPATVSVVDSAFPGFAGLEPELRVLEEWYSLKEFSALDHVLLVLHTAGMKGNEYQRPNYPMAWAKPYGRGRVWYNGMGHREDVWDAAFFQAMLVGAIEWTGGRTPATMEPNLLEAAPGAMQLPPPRQP